MRLIVIIPARSGSKGVPDKNITILNGESLLSRAYRFAESIIFPEKTICVSTDSPCYLDIVKKLGYADKLLRPDYLSTSQSLVIDSVLYELDRTFAKDEDVCLLIEPSFVGARTGVFEGITKLLDNQIDSCFGAVEVPPSYNFKKQFEQTDSGVFPVNKALNINRQTLSPAYIRSGEFYISRVGLIRQHRNLFGGRLALVKTTHPFVNIDEPSDIEDAIKIASVVYS